MPTVTEGLRVYIQRRCENRAIDLFGKTDFDLPTTSKEFRQSRRRSR
jgi:hypothetical protein